MTRNAAEDLAAYGSRLGIVEPLLIRCGNNALRLDIIIEQLRSRKDYALSDQLREIRNEVYLAAQYAFPARFK